MALVAHQSNNIVSTKLVIFQEGVFYILNLPFSCPAAVLAFKGCFFTGWCHHLHIGDWNSVWGVDPG